MQVAIDGCKRLYAVNASDEIRRIRAQKCMCKSKDYPKFMKFTHKIPITRNGKERPYKDIAIDKKKVEKRIDKKIICPMNWMQERLERIQGSSTEEYTDDFLYLTERPKARINNNQMNKIRAIVEEFDAFARRYSATAQYDDDDDFVDNALVDKSEDVYEIVSKMKVNPATMHRLVESTLGYNDSVHKDKIYKKASKYALRTFNVLYRANKELFLGCFVRKSACSS